MATINGRCGWINPAPRRTHARQTRNKVSGVWRRRSAAARAAVSRVVRESRAQVTQRCRMNGCVWHCDQRNSASVRRVTDHTNANARITASNNSRTSSLTVYVRGRFRQIFLELRISQWGSNANLVPSPNLQFFRLLPVTCTPQATAAITSCGAPDFINFHRTKLRPVLTILWSTVVFSMILNFARCLLEVTVSWYSNF